MADAAGTWTLHGAPVTLDLTWSCGRSVVGRHRSAGGQSAGGGRVRRGDTARCRAPSSYEHRASHRRLRAGPRPRPGIGLSEPPRGRLLADGDGRQHRPGPGLDRVRRPQGRRVSSPRRKAISRPTRRGRCTSRSIKTCGRTCRPFPLLAEPTFVAFSASVVGVQSDPGGLGAALADGPVGAVGGGATDASGHDDDERGFTRGALTCAVHDTTLA